MKSLVVVLMLMVPALVSAQGVFTNTTHTALQKVIGDYPNHFKNIKGRQVAEDPQTMDYASTVQIPGSVNTVITRYNSSPDKEVYSWKSLMLETEDFETGSKRYKDLYNQIRNSIIKVEGEKPFILNGTYEAPTEEKKFVASTFYLLPAAGSMGKVKVELALEYYVTEWKVTLLVYDQEEAAVVME